MTRYAAGRRCTSAAGEQADVFVIFGITGDLAKVMTFRSLYRLERRGLLDCPIVGVAVDDWTVDQLNARAKESIVGTGEPLDQEVFDRLAARFSYVQRRLHRRRDLQARRRGDRRVRASGLLPRDPAVPLRPGRRGPRGRRADGERARRRREAVRPRPRLRPRARGRAAHSTSTSRSSTGSTTTSGRWAPRRCCISGSRTRCWSPSGAGTTSSSVQITMAEDFGVEDRGHFYDPVGALRDVVVNHLMQLVAVCAMEAPARGDPDDDQGRAGLALPRGQGGGSGPLRARPVRRLPRHRRRRAGLDDRDVRGPAPRDRELALGGRALLHPHRQAAAGHADRAPAGLQAPAAARLRSLRPRHRAEPARRQARPVDRHQARRRGASRPTAPGRSSSTWSSRRKAARGRRRTRCCSRRRWSATDTRFTRQDGVEETWRVMQPLLDAPPPVHTYAPGSWGPEAANASSAATAAGTAPGSSTELEATRTER